MGKQIRRGGQAGGRPGNERPSRSTRRFTFRRSPDCAIKWLSRFDEKTRRNSSRGSGRGKSRRKDDSPSAHRQRAMIGITFALPSESSGLVRRLQAVQRHGKLLSGRIDSRDVIILHTGVGASDCHERLEILLHKTRPSLVISSGFAGAVAEQLRVGDLIFAQNFSHSGLLANADRILGDRRPRVVKLFTSTSIIDSIEERNEIARGAGAEAVDMGTGGIADVCKGHGGPLRSLRVISGALSQPVPAPPSLLFEV